MTCNKCGKEIPEGATCDCAAQPEKKKKSKLKILLLLSPLIVFLVIVILLSSGGEEGGNSASIIAFENDSGAVFDMSLDDFSDRFNQALDDSSEYLGKGENQFEIDSYWNNMVEPMDGTEELSGAKFTTYTAFVDSVVISANIQSGKLASAKCSFSEYEMGSYFGVHIAMALSGLDVEEASKIIDTIADGAENNTMIYKGGILYSLIPVGSTDLAWNIIAASDDFISKLENSGKCNVLRW